MMLGVISKDTFHVGHILVLSRVHVQILTQLSNEFLQQAEQLTALTVWNNGNSYDGANSVNLKGKIIRNFDFSHHIHSDEVVNSLLK